MYERAVCSRDRIEYLIEKRVLQREEVAFLCDIINSECVQALALQNYILKKRFGGNINDEKVKKCLLNISNAEETFTDDMIKCLETIIAHEEK